MSIVGQDPTPGACVKHPRRETALRCGKCGDFICTKCMIVTPVGVRCRTCAQLRRLPQFEVGPILLLSGGLAGLVVSSVVWFLISFLFALRFFLSILVGIAVGETISRLTRGRSNRLLEVVAVTDVVLGLGVSEVARSHQDLHYWFTRLSNDPSFLVFLLVPAAIASYIAVVKLR